MNENEIMEGSYLNVTVVRAEIFSLMDDQFKDNKYFVEIHVGDHQKFDTSKS